MGHKSRTATQLITTGGGTEGSERVCAGGRGIDLKISTPLVGYSYRPNYRCVAKLECRKKSLWIYIIPLCPNR